MVKETFQLNELIEYPKSGILSKVLLKSDTKDVISKAKSFDSFQKTLLRSFEITLFCMSKGSELSEHTSTKEGFVHVLEGNGTFILKGKKILMKKGILIHMGKNAKHSLKATKNMAFLLILSN